MPSIRLAPPGSQEPPAVASILEAARAEPPRRSFRHVRCDECGCYVGQTFPVHGRQVCGLDAIRLGRADVLVTGEKE